MTQLAHPLTRRPRTWLAAVVLIGVLALAAAVALGSRAADRATQPMRADVQLPSGRATAASLRTLAVDDLGPTTDVPRYAASSGLDRVRQAGCRDGACALAFNTDYTPALHVNYQERVLRIRDGLPKYKDMPAEMGGSGDTLPE